MSLDAAKFYCLWYIISLGMHEKCQLVKQGKGIFKIRKGKKKEEKRLNLPSNDDSL